MSDHGWGSTPGAGNISQYVISHPGQLSLAIPLSWHNEHHIKGGDALQLGSKGRYGSCHV